MSNLLPPRRREWTRGKYQVGCFVRTPKGAVYQSAAHNPDAAQVAAAIDLLFGGAAEFELLRRIAKYAREDRATTPGCTRLARALATLEKLRKPAAGADE